MRLLGLLVLMILPACVSLNKQVLKEFDSINAGILQEDDWHLVADAMPALVLNAANLFRYSPQDPQARQRLIKVQFLYTYAILQTKWLGEKWLQIPATNTVSRLTGKYAEIVSHILNLRKQGIKNAQLSQIYIISVYEWSRLPQASKQAKLLMSTLNAEAQELCRDPLVEIQDFCTLMPLQLKLQQPGLTESKARQIAMKINSLEYGDRGYANIVLLEQYVIPFEDEDFLNQILLQKEADKPSLWVSTSKQRMFAALKAKDFLF